MELKPAPRVGITSSLRRRVTGYRVHDHAVLVDPRTHTIVQIID